ncbi:ATPase [[Mycobacterium] kokjensenii]|uniref:ATPase n=1 Tax=[Mycobacterium] kokjensenii TaxID=3064287 RepID=A0ABM9LHR5_9MYCO|nr:ATPase [Mycolicibacter sp. MU0083]CAJ1499209.1 ATPase [Mycolicibacter sp. MU0083]
MGTMADRTPGTGTERKRLKTLAQAALNADVTVGQLEDVLGGLGNTMVELNSSLANLNATVERLGGGLDHLEETMAGLDDLARRLVTLIEPVEAIVNRIDYLVEVGETAMAPLTATENAVRGLFNAMRNRAR